jgi:hypothetical protein
MYSLSHIFVMVLFTMILTTVHAGIIHQQCITSSAGMVCRQLVIQSIWVQNISNGGLGLYNN